MLLARAPEEVDARAELDACAERIEVLKAKRREGQAAERQLERLLIRAQELAAELERARAELPATPAAPAPEELHERADAARDEADRIAAEIAELDVKISDARREVRGESGPTLTRAALGSAGAASAEAAERLRSLIEKRAALAQDRSLAAATAARLEAEARASEAEP